MKDLIEDLYFLKYLSSTAIRGLVHGSVEKKKKTEVAGCQTHETAH